MNRLRKLSANQILLELKIAGKQNPEILLKTLRKLTILPWRACSFAKTS